MNRYINCCVCGLLSLTIVCEHCLKKEATQVSLQWPRITQANYIHVPADHPPEQEFNAEGRPRYSYFGSGNAIAQENPRVFSGNWSGYRKV